MAYQNLARWSIGWRYGRQPEDAEESADGVTRACRV